MTEVVTEPNSVPEREQRLLEDVASWLERCCRTGSLYERAEIAAALRLGKWRTDKPRRTADRDAPGAHEQAERRIRRQVDQRGRADAAKAAVAAGATPMHDRFGRPVGAAMKSYLGAADVLGFGGDPDCARVFEYPADGSTVVYNGAGQVVEVWPNGRRPRRQTRLAGHAYRTVRCLQCKPRHADHAACECGEWWATDHHGWISKSAHRAWHRRHKDRVRAEQMPGVARLPVAASQQPAGNDGR